MLYSIMLEIISFNSLPTKECPGCFQALAIMNEAARISVFRFSCGHKFSPPLSKYQGVKLLDCMVKVKVFIAQLFPILCDSMDCSPSRFTAHGILQAKILECITISFSRRSSQSRLMVSHFCFYLHFSDDNWYEATFHMLFANLYISSLVRYLFKYLTHFLMGLFIFFLIVLKFFDCFG